MNKLLKQLEKETTHIRLTEAQKGAMRARLHEAMGVSLRAPAPVVSPYHWFLMSRTLVSLSLVLVVLVGTGTAFAAEGSLPGDILYPVKININERVETALALSTRAKVEVNTKLAQRRIAEVETLALRGTLDATTTAQAEENFDYHMARVVVAASRETHPKETAIFSAKITASLNSRDERKAPVAALAAQAPTTTIPAREDKNQQQGRSAKENSERFTQHVRARVEGVLNLKIGSSASVGTSSDTANPPPAQREAGRLLQRIRE